MKKRTAVFVTAAVLVLSLTACGNQGGKTHDGGNTGSGGTSQSDNGGTGSNEGGTVGGDLRGALDDAGRAVEDAADGVRHAAGMTSFERMLDNARVHDVDGILTDGENAAW